MSPINQKKLDKLRKKLDLLDDKLLNIIKKRTTIINNVIKLKKNKKEVIDRNRIKNILKNIKIKSKRKKIDTKVTNKIWKEMISAYIDYEFRKLKKK